MLTKTSNGLEELIETFGSLDTSKFENRYIVPFTLPYPLYYDATKVTRARCHYLIIDNFKKGFEDIRNAGLQDEAKNYR